jgi:hypothetical protein
MISRREQIKEDIGDWFNQNKAKIDKYQDYLDFAGMIPGVGNILDLANAGVDVLQKDYLDAGIRGTQAIPGFGIAAALGGGLVKDAVQQNKARTQPAQPTQAQQPQGQDDSPANLESPTDSDSQDYAKYVSNMLRNRMFNTRLVSNAPLATWNESCESAIEQLSENIISNIVAGGLKKLRGKPKAPKGKKKDEPEEEKGPWHGDYKLRDKLLNRKGFLLTPAALAGLGLAAPFAIDKVFGGADKLGPGGTPLGIGSRGEALPHELTAFDKLQPVLGYMGNYNPAGFALNALGRRIGI